MQTYRAEEQACRAGRVRISNAQVGATIGVEYSTMSPFSKDNKWLLLTHPSGFFGLYTGDGVFQRILPGEVSTSSRPRWSRTDPDQFTFLWGNELRWFRVDEDIQHSMHTFEEYSSIDDDGEAEISLDGDHRVLCGMLPNGQKEVFVFELSTATKGPVFPQAEPFDGLKISGANQAILSRDAGLFALGPQQRQLTTCDGHAAIGRDTNGDDILLWTNAALVPSDPSFPNGVMKIRIADGKQTGLFAFPWVDAVDITMPEAGDCCYVSTYGSAENSGSLYQIKLDGSSYVLLRSGINHDVKSYDGQPKAAVSRDGSRIVYAATEPDGVTVNAWMVRLDAAPIAVVLTDLPNSPFSGFQRVATSAFSGKHYLIDLAPDGTFTEYRQV